MLNKSKNKLTPLNKNKVLMKELRSRFFIKENQTSIFSTLISLFFLFILAALVIFVNLNSIGLSADSKIRLDIYRVLQMILTGFSLGVASYLLQRLCNNRLADTSIMGLGNANLLLLIAMLLPLNLDDQNATSTILFYVFKPWIFIIFSTLITLVFNLFAKEKLKHNISKLIIAGILMNFISMGIAFSVKTKLNIPENNLISNYLMGSISSRLDDWSLFVPMAMIFVATVWLMINSYKIKLLIMNPDISHQLGVNNKSITMQTLICIGIFVGSSYSMSGDFVFVGLFAGNIAFGFSRNKISSGILTSGFIGSCLILVVYFIFENLINLNPISIVPKLIPVVIIPYFLYILLKKRK